MKHWTATERIATVTLLTFCAAMFVLPARVEAQSRSRLQSRLNETRSRAKAARADLAAKRERAKAARNQLVETQQELAAAEARLARAKRRLATTQEELAQVRKELAATRKRLAAHQEAMGQTLLALFRSKEPSYAEVLLRATSFEDFANRAAFSRLITERDENVLVYIVDDKNRIQAQQKLLQEKEAEQKELKAKVARERGVVAEKAARAATLAKRAQTDVKEAERQLDAQEAEARAIAAMLKRLASGSGRYRYYGKWSGNFLRPVPGPITSPYGWRIHPITHTRRFHNGIDIGCPGGTSIHCAAAGKLVSTGWRGAYGLTVIVDHGSGVSTMYAHCQRGSIRVSPGQSVSKGQTLARVDSTGWSTGNHLHWTVFKNGRSVNPFSI